MDRYILSEYAYQKVYRPTIPLIDGAAEMLELMEHRATTGELDVIVTLPHDRAKWFELFSSLCKEREEMYSPEKMINVYENYVELWKKLRYNKHVYRYDLFENMEGQFKGQILKINE